MNKAELIKLINDSNSVCFNEDLDLEKMEKELNWFYPLMKDLYSTIDGNPILHSSMAEQYKDATIFDDVHKRKIEEAPTGMGKSGLIFYICVQWFLKNKDKENCVFHLINPLNVLNDQTTFDLVFVLKHFIEEFNFNADDFVILFNRSGVNDAAKNLENTKFEDGTRIIKDEFSKFNCYKDKKFKIVISCVPSVPNVDMVWNKEDCCCVIDEVHTMKCSNNNMEDEESDTNRDWTEIWRVINDNSAYIRGITATSTKELLEQEFNLYTKNGIVDDNINVIYFDEALNSRRVVKPHAIYQSWKGTFSLNGIMVEQKQWNDEAELNNPISKILWSANNNEEIASILSNSDYNGIFYISTCDYGKVKGRVNNKVIEILSKNMTVKQFSDSIENETEDCYIFHIKQLIAGVNVKGLTGCVLQTIESKNNYITTKQTIGRCLRKKGNKNGGIVTFLIEDVNNGKNSGYEMDSIKELMFVMYGNNWSCKETTKKGRKKGKSKDNNPQQNNGGDDIDASTFTWVLKLQEEVNNLNNMIERCQIAGNTTLAQQCEQRKRLLINDAAIKNSSLGHSKKCVSMLECFLDNSTWEIL